MARTRRKFCTTIRPMMIGRTTVGSVSNQQRVQYTLLLMSFLFTHYWVTVTIALSMKQQQRYQQQQRNIQQKTTEKEIFVVPVVVQHLSSLEMIRNTTPRTTTTTNSSSSSISSRRNKNALISTKNNDSNLVRNFDQDLQQDDPISKRYDNTRSIYETNNNHDNQYNPDTTTTTNALLSLSSRRVALKQFATFGIVLIGTTTSQSFVVVPAEAIETINDPVSTTTTTVTTIPETSSSSSVASVGDVTASEQSLLSSSSSLIAAAVASSSSASEVTAAVAVDWGGIFQKASKKALGGGKAGALAAVVQVLSLMWLRTCMNYQYRYGGTLQSSITTLYKEGGISRLYQGLPFALIQGPMTRFGDTAANVGILALLDTIPYTQLLPLPLKTVCGSITAGLWRIVLMPVDTCKTASQVTGPTGLQELIRSVQIDGIGVLYRGSVAQAAATAVGHFPWFFTYNFLDTQLFPVVDRQEDLLLYLVRSAVLGVSASCVSDCCSNSLRVIKTTKQTASLNNNYNTNTTTTSNEILEATTSNVDKTDNSSPIMNSNITAVESRQILDATTPIQQQSQQQQTQQREYTYREVVTMILEQDGIVGLFGRGLQTRLLTNAIQGAAFSVLWRYFQQQ